MPSSGPTLEARSPYNVVRIDLPQATTADPYAHAAELLAQWRARRRDRPRRAAGDLGAGAGLHRTRRQRAHPPRASSRACAWSDYGAGRIRPHERTHPGPREDRLRLTRATRANLSPIFSLFSDPDGTAQRALGDGVTRARPVGGDDRRRRDRQPALAGHRRGGDRGRPGGARNAELLIADGHHRYETARVYAEEIGGEGPHRYVLMCLVALEDPGLTVFPTHRLVRGLRPDQHETLAQRAAGRLRDRARSTTPPR